MGVVLVNKVVLVVDGYEDIENLVLPWLNHLNQIWCWYGDGSFTTVESGSKQRKENTFMLIFRT